MDSSKGRGGGLLELVGNGTMKENVARDKGEEIDIAVFTINHCMKTAKLKGENQTILPTYCDQERR